MEKQLLIYQNMAMRTLGFAYKIIDDSDANDCIELMAKEDLSF